jgi:hypothetical protein
MGEKDHLGEIELEITERDGSRSPSQSAPSTASSRAQARRDVECEEYYDTD